MSTSFMISIPSDEPELRDEIEQALAAHARVNEVPKKFTDLNQIKLIVEIIAGVATTGGVAIATTIKVIEFLLMLKDRYKNSKKPSGIHIAVPGSDDVPLDAADAAILKRILGLEK